MEQKPRRFTKTICVYDPSGRTICGKVAKEKRDPYAIIKLGRVFSLKSADGPQPKSYVLEISRPGAYRIQDGQDTISLMIEENGVEGTTERWEEWKFETLNPMPMATMIRHNGQMVDAELKYCKGMGMIEPYTKNDFDRKEMPALPGVEQSKYEVRELRQKIREEREAQAKGLLPQPRDMRVREEEQMQRAQEVVRQEKTSYKWEDDIDFDQPKDTQVRKDFDEERHRQEQRAQRRNEQNERDEELHRKLEAFEQNILNKAEKMEQIVEEVSEESEEEEVVESYITAEYIERMSKQQKTKDERFMSYAQMMPQAQGDFDRILVTKKVKWDNVPLFIVNESRKAYELQAIGECVRVVFAVKGTNLLILPAGV
ncbi:NS2 [Pata virus]|nr:NS2 [Pata virus]